MTVTAVNCFTPAGIGSMAVTAVSSRLALPGAGFQTALLTNHGPYAIRFLLGNSTVVVTDATGITVLPGQAFPPLGTGANTHIAAKTVGGGPFQSEMNITTGA